MVTIPYFLEYYPRILLIWAIEIMWILFEGGDYLGAGTVIFTHVVTPRWGQVMEQMVVNSIMRGHNFYKHTERALFPNKRRSSTTSTWTSFLHPHKLLPWLLIASPTTWPQLSEWAGADTNWEQILFHSACTTNHSDNILGWILFDMQVLFEEMWYTWL